MSIKSIHEVNQMNDIELDDYASHLGRSMQELTEYIDCNGHWLDEARHREWQRIGQLLSHIDARLAL